MDTSGRAVSDGAGAAQPISQAADVVATLHLDASRDDAQVARHGREFVETHSHQLPQEMIEDAQLLVSEIVSNASLAGRSDITLRVRSDPPGIGIAVDDDGPGMPVVAAPPVAPTATSGRGLRIVDALATAWGVVPHVPPPGKTVWFEIES